MKTFISFVRKESRHILRDRRTVMILFGIPVVMMMLFGFALSNDVRNVRTVIVTASMDDATQRVVQCLGASEYFNLTATVPSPADAERLIREQKADMAVVFSPRFGSHRYDNAAVQLIVDASDPNMAVQRCNYARQIITSEMLRMTNQGSVSPSGRLSVKMLYNPQMRSAYNFVPGLMGLLLMIVCAMMTSVSIVREKETGTMDVLLVSPVRPLMVIVGKAVPYLVLSLLIMACILVISTTVLDVPVRGSLWLIFMLSLLYIMLSLSLGLLISVIARTQLVAMLASAMVLLLPTLLLSGLIYPVESMPAVLQGVSAVMPARWFISAMRKLLIMGVGIGEITKELLVLLCMTAALLSLALFLFNRQTGLRS